MKSNKFEKIPAILDESPPAFSPILPYPAQGKYYENMVEMLYSSAFRFLPPNDVAHEKKR
jgi:hypothetical protein